MKILLIPMLLIVYTNTIFAGDFYFGVEINSLVINEKSYFGSETKEIVKNLRGDIQDKTPVAFIAGLYEVYNIGEHVSLVARQRYFSSKTSAEFSTQNYMNFNISKNIVLLNAGIRFRLMLDDIFGFYAEILPGTYIIDSFENGYFGNYHDRDVSFGANFGFGGDFIVKQKINIGMGIIYEHFSIPQKNIILEDGGDGGGIGLVLRVGGIF
ncbi:MAG: hypothetical protein N3B13_09495 [Deltaproteobacteria bacterium]|nr:hypothetical protein [Deltaproteobacteria bacterium]